MSWKPEFLCQGSWCSNGQAFATESEASKSAFSRFSRWTIPSDWRAVESDAPVNYEWVDGVGDKSVPEVVS